MRGTSFHVFTGHLGEFEKAKNVSLSESFQIRKTQTMNITVLRSEITVNFTILCESL